tara:strand:+ start:1854 stop:2318 length:465 start_codon:yes stop_codon:yes gene_type:complete
MSSKKYYKKRLYLFDFDNTLANTAEIIKEQGYGYQFSELRFYKKMLNIISCRISRGNNVMILSCRNKKFKQKILSSINEKIDYKLAVHLVPYHFLKFFYILRFRLMSKLTIVDDMYRNEENDDPKKLFFPKLKIPGVRYIIHNKVLKLRGNEIL